MNVLEKYLSNKLKFLLHRQFKMWPAYVEGIIDDEGKILRYPETEYEYRIFGAYENLIRKIKILMRETVPNQGSVLRDLVPYLRQVDVDLEDIDVTEENKHVSQ